MRKYVIPMCTTWAQAARNLCATAVCKYPAKMRVCTSNDLFAYYPPALHHVAHKVVEYFSSVAGRVIPTIHSTYKEPKTFTLNNINTKACGERL